jgi:hypothetical protein
MKELIERILNGGMTAFAGLELTGTIPVADDSVNEVLKTALAHGIEVPDIKTVKVPKADIDVNALLPHIKKLEVRSENKKVTYEFVIRVDTED